jgi:hypothetical protein
MPSWQSMQVVGAGLWLKLPPVQSVFVALWGA